VSPEPTILTQRLDDAVNRLDKIDEKIDKLSEAMIMLARAEERLSRIDADYVRMWEMANTLKEDVEKLHDSVSEYKASIATFNKLFWILITSAAALIVSSVVSSFI
jgi:predicted nuclease with TOPRIM domain